MSIRKKPLRIGDRVRVIRSGYYAEQLQVGATGVITQYCGNQMFGVTMDCSGSMRERASIDLQGWAFEKSELEPIP